MIFRNRKYQNDKRINPFIGILLFFVSIILLVLTAPFGLIYGLFYTLFKKGVAGLGEFALRIAISIDQLGNVIMQHLLNKIWLKEGAYNFGNRDETVSSVLGRNKNLGLLTGFGDLIDRLLDILDPDHSLNSIDYYIQPSEQILEKVAWICLQEGRLLCVRSSTEDNYHLPDGSRSTAMTDTINLSQQMERKLNVQLDMKSFVPVGIFEGKSREVDEIPLIQLHCYRANYTGSLLPHENIKEIVWLEYADRNLVPIVDTLVFDFLKEKGLLG